MNRAHQVGRSVVGIGSALALAASLHSAPAAAAPILSFAYDVDGEATIASTGSTVGLGPAILDAELDYATGEFTASMPLPGTETEFHLIGLLPVTADVAFEETSPIIGTISPGVVQSRVDAVASYHLRLSNIRVVGFPLFAGPYCRTIDPISIPISSPPEGGFLLFAGGPVSGEFAIGDFQHCGLNTWLINAIIPGGGNQVDLQIGPIRS